MALTAAVGVLAAVLVTGAGVRTVMHTSRAPRLLTEGIAALPCAPQDVIIVPVHRDVRYDGASSVLLPAAGAAPGCTVASVAASERWLAAGTVPGTGPAMRSMAERALLDLHLSVRPDGAVVAAGIRAGITRGRVFRAGWPWLSRSPGTARTPCAC